MQLPIYDTSEGTVLLESHVTPLEKKVHQFRLSAMEGYESLTSRFSGLTERWIEVERSIEQEVSKIVPPRTEEDVLPGAIYVGVATLAGSIMARNREWAGKDWGNGLCLSADHVTCSSGNILLRLLTPPTFLIGSSLYFLPKTSHRLSDYLESWSKNYPTLHTYHRQLLDSSSVLSNKTAELSTQVGGAIEERLHQGAQFVEDKTGLKVGQVLEQSKLGAVKREKEVVKEEMGKKMPEIVSDRKV